MRAALLLAVHPPVGQADQAGEFGRFIGVTRRTEIDMQGKRSYTRAVLAAGKVLDPFRQIIGAAHAEQELVAAVANHEVAPADAAVEPPGDRPEEFVAADPVPVGVVDLLEPLEIDKNELEGRLTPNPGR